MKNKINSVFLLIIIIISLSVPVMGYVEIGEGKFLEKIEPIIEVANLVIGIIAIMIGISIFHKLGELGASIKKGLRYLIIGVGFFVVFESLQVLKLLNIFKWHGLADIFEIMFISSLLVATFSIKKFIGEINNMKENITKSIIINKKKVRK